MYDFLRLYKRLSFVSAAPTCGPWDGGCLYHRALLFEIVRGRAQDEECLIAASMVFGLHER